MPYYPQHSNFRIREDGSRNDLRPFCVEIEVDDLHSLPAALRRLAEMGHNMTRSLEALQEACEDQRKRKALDAAIADIAKKSEKA